MQRPWYRKKRYILPLLLVGITAWLSPDTSTQQASIVTPVQTEEREQSIPVRALPTSAPIAQPEAERNAKQLESNFAPPEAAPARSEISVAPAIESTTSNTADTYRNVDGNIVSAPVYAPTAPAGASAKCRDGTYSFSQNRRGTCSYHGGVEEWL
jgi:hypothetical protein